MILEDKAKDKAKIPVEHYETYSEMTNHKIRPL